MRVQVINKKLPEGRNFLQNLVHTFNANGEMIATRSKAYFASAEEAIAKLKECGLEPNEDIVIVPYKG